MPKQQTEEHDVACAESFISEYKRMMQMTRREVLARAMIMDAGPAVIRGFKVLCDREGVVRPNHDFVHRET